MESIQSTLLKEKGRRNRAVNLFEQNVEHNPDRPLADRMRPQTMEEYVGQAHLLGKGCLLRHLIEKDRLVSLILWGPPGSGKTTLANIIASETRCYFVSFSAVLSGVKEIRTVVEEAKNRLLYNKMRTILFVDEIHRFSKSQQDAFLPHVESGLITLIGATTENPSFEVIPPLLSRSRVLLLKPFSEDELTTIIKQAVADKTRGLGRFNIEITEEALKHIIWSSDGDARTALNSLEAAALLTSSAGGIKVITPELVEEAIQKKSLRYDKAGEEHYNLISAFHKSLRGSDPDAALYWMGRMLVAGEDPLYIARRMVRFASEDIGNADPQALTLSIAAMQAFQFLGSPEGELALAQTAIYLATAPKSNASYLAYNDARETITKTGYLPVPLHIRNAPTKLMRDIGYGKDYKYAHNFKDAYVNQEYLPESLNRHCFYLPAGRGFEKIIKERMDYWNKIRRSNGKDAKKEAPGDHNDLPAQGRVKD